MSNIKFAKRPIGEVIKDNQKLGGRVRAFDVSSYAEQPFNYLSPFTFSNEIAIPVPGMKDVYSRSVESIWQGLKIVDGSPDFGLFERKPKKRKGNVTGHIYGDEVLGLVDARLKIYLPSYTFFLNNYAPAEALEEILDEQRKGREVYLYDVEGNDDIQNPSPLAHASVLASYLNMKIFNKALTPENKTEERLFAILEDDSSIEDKVNLIEPLLSDKNMKRALRYRCVEHPQNFDDFYIGERFKNEVKRK